MLSEALQTFCHLQNSFSRTQYLSLQAPSKAVLFPQLAFACEHYKQQCSMSQVLQAGRQRSGCSGTATVDPLPEAAGASPM